MAMVFQCDICGKIQKATDERRAFRIYYAQGLNGDEKPDDICCNICMDCRDRIMKLVEGLKGGCDRAESQSKDENIFPYPGWCESCVRRGDLKLACFGCSWSNIDAKPNLYVE